MCHNALSGVTLEYTKISVIFYSFLRITAKYPLRSSWSESYAVPVHCRGAQWRQKGWTFCFHGLPAHGAWFLQPLSPRQPVRKGPCVQSENIFKHYTAVKNIMVIWYEGPRFPQQYFAELKALTLPHSWEQLSHVYIQIVTEMRNFILVYCQNSYWRNSTHDCLIKSTWMINVSYTNTVRDSYIASPIDL